MLQISSERVLVLICINWNTRYLGLCIILEIPEASWFLDVCLSLKLSKFLQTLGSLNRIDFLENSLISNIFLNYSVFVIF